MTGTDQQQQRITHLFEAPLESDPRHPINWQLSGVNAITSPANAKGVGFAHFLAKGMYLSFDNIFSKELREIVMLSAIWWKVSAEEFKVEWQSGDAAPDIIWRYFWRDIRFSSAVFYACGPGV